MKMNQKFIQLHRFVSTEKLIDLIENKHLVLIKPEKWLDPFENNISRVKFIKNGKVSYIKYLKNIYGICLTKAKESNLIWDSYTPNGSGVRITFDKNLLIDTILKSKYNSHNFLFNDVKYIEYDKILSPLKDKKQLIEYFNKPGKELLKNLFYKRNAYRYEEEFRIIYNANGDKETYNKILTININPQELIKKILFHPKMTDTDCEAIKKYLIRQGISKNKIFRSLLYKKQITKTIKL